MVCDTNTGTWMDLDQFCGYRSVAGYWCENIGDGERPLIVEDCGDEFFYLTKDKTFLYICKNGFVEKDID